MTHEANGKDDACELHCEDCDQDYTIWSADNDLWNAVMRGPGSEETREPFLCARCFLIRAEPVTEFARVTWPEHPSRRDRERGARPKDDASRENEHLRDLVERLRALDEEAFYQQPATAHAICQEAADHIITVEGENETLRLAICGGEDAPGYAASLSLETILGVLRDNHTSWQRDAELAAHASNEPATPAQHSAGKEG